MKNNNQDEMIVDEFYDLMKAAEQRVMHAAHQVIDQDQVKSWEWELAGAYIIANSCSTVAMACDGLRLARFTVPTGLATLDNQMRSFLPHHYKRGCEDDTFYDLFPQIFATWSTVKNATIYNREDLINRCVSDQRGGMTTTKLGLTLNVKHVLDFC